MSDIKPNTPSTEKSIPDTTTADTAVPISQLEDAVDNLEVSKPAIESKEVKTVAEPEELPEKNVYEGDGNSATTSEDEAEPSKELGLVISALQSTVKQNQEKVQAAEKKEEEGRTTKEEHEQKTKEAEEELHSVGDNDKFSVDDNNSVTTSSSTNVSQEEEKIMETTTTTTTTEDADIPSTFEKIVQDVLPPTPGVAPQRQTFDLGGRASEEVGDVESYSANLIALDKIDTKEIKANELSPRQQERAGNLEWIYQSNIHIYKLCTIDEPVLRAIRHLFNNRFMKAKKLFEKQAETYGKKKRYA